MSFREPDGLTATARWWRWPLLTILFGICLAQVGLYLVAFLFGGIDRNPIDLLLALQPLMWALPGLVVLRQAKWHPVGWTLVATGIGFGLSFDLGYVVIWDEYLGMPRAWSAWILDGWGSYVSFIGILAVLSVFPDGFGPVGSRLRRWRLMRILAGVALLAITAMQETNGGFDGNTIPVGYPNPTGLGVVPAAIGAFVAIPILGLVAAAVWSLRRRASEASDSMRRQYSWVLFPFGAMVCLIIAALVLSEVFGDAVWLPVVAAYVSIPIAFSIAMVRHRWFDIDRLVSRTVSYALVATFVVGIYSIPALLLPELLGLSSDLMVAGATLLAAAAVSPLRNRVQRAVDSRFNRGRYDAERLMTEFAVGVQAAESVAGLSRQVGDVVSRSLGPRSVGIWFDQLDPPRTPA